MIYIDKEGVTIIEYGHGSIFGFATGGDEDGVFMYGLVVADPGKINRPCEVFPELKGKPLGKVNPSVVFKFSKKESLGILIGGLQEIHDRMQDTN